MPLMVFLQPSKSVSIFWIHAWALLTISIIEVWLIDLQLRALVCNVIYFFPGVLKATETSFQEVKIGYQLVTVSACKDFQVSDQIQIILLDNLKDSSECSAADKTLPGTESGVLDQQALWTTDTERDWKEVDDTHELTYKTETDPQTQKTNMGFPKRKGGGIK